MQIARLLSIRDAKITVAARKPTSKALYFQELICDRELACAMLTLWPVAQAALVETR
jgi:hypothetical protein